MSSPTNWFLDGGRCPCGGDLATNGELVWCTADGCGYRRECGDWTCGPTARERQAARAEGDGVA